MASINAPAGAPAVLRAGGATRSGPPKGIYAVEVTQATSGASTKKGTPYLELEFTVKNDEHNPSREGKKLLSQRFYFPHPEADPEKAETMKGMLKRSIFKGLNVPWPKEDKSIDPRQFVGKKAFVLLDFEKPQEGRESDELRMEVKRITQDRSKLEAAAERAEGEVQTATKVTSKPQSARR